MSKGKILSKCKIYGYKMYDYHWNLSWKYLLNTEQILIISSYWNCGITTNPKNRIIYKNEMSYQCFKCSENIFLCAEHVMFKLGEKVKCPNCSSEISFIKINKNCIFKRPKLFHWINFNFNFFKFYRAC